MRQTLAPSFVLCALIAGSALASPLPKHAVTCANGVAEGFPCSNVDLQSHITNSQLGGGSGNDLWGWTDPGTGKEYALMGLTNGTAFVDISDPEFPIRLGRLPTHSGNSVWRDIKTYGNYAYIVSEAMNHGMQVFDLRRLRTSGGATTVFTEDAHYPDFGRSHNIVINPASGYAYAVGAREDARGCATGLHMIDIRTPLAPVFAGCFGADGYTHDAQCVNYTGPDADHVGEEVCFAANEDTVTIVGVSNKSAPVQLSRTTYAGSAYTHQGWLTDDQRYFLVNDEVDELNFGHGTRTYVFDVSNLDSPRLHTTYTAAVLSSDHNLYVRGRYAYLANYRSGLRILDLSNIDGGTLTEAAFFDTQPGSNAAGTSGMWSVYPFFASGTVIASDVSAGLFVLKPQLCTSLPAVANVQAAPAGANQINLSWTAGAASTRYDVYRAIDGCGGAEELIAQNLNAASFSDGTASGSVSYGYRVRSRDASGTCLGEFSTCAAAQTTGQCTAPPAFTGLANAASAGSSQCAINLGWAAGSARCAGPVRYQVQRTLGPSFVPAAATTVASDLSDLNYADVGAQFGNVYSYRVRALDAGNNSVDSNSVNLSVRPSGPAINGTWRSGAEIGDTLLDITGGSSRHVGWEVVSDVANTGQRSYFSTYSESACLGLYSPPIALTAGQSAQLSFFTRYGIQTGFDAGIVQISTNDGGTWQTISPVGGYPSAMNNSNSADACGFANGQPAFTGTNLNWQNVVFNLASFSGTVKLRWLLSTDATVSAPGWWIDDVAITNVQVPGPCSDGINLFRNGFEAP